MIKYVWIYYIFVKTKKNQHLFGLFFGFFGPSWPVKTFLLKSISLAFLTWWPSDLMQKIRKNWWASSGTLRCEQTIWQSFTASFPNKVLRYLKNFGDSWRPMLYLSQRNWFIASGSTPEIKCRVRSNEFEKEMKGFRSFHMLKAG